MKQVLTAAQMQEAESYTIEKLGIPSIVLMERAALAVTKRIMTLYPKTEGSNVILFFGVGNNGAEGLAVASQLFQERYRVSVFVVGNTKKETREFALQNLILRNMLCLQINRYIGALVSWQMSCPYLLHWRKSHKR